MTASRAAAPVAWTLLAFAVLDLAWRQLTRAALLEVVDGPAWAIGWTLALALLAAGWIIERPRSSSATRKVALFLALVAAGSVVQGRLGARLQSDGFYYYAFARSIWFDHDVDLTNDYRRLGLDDAQHQHLFTPTATGHAQTTWAIGPALLWSPFIGLGHVAAVWAGAHRPDVAADGTSFPYRQAVCLAGLCYGLLGLFACYAIARTRFGARVSTLAVAAAGGGSFVLWYLVREPTMSHAVSMAAVSAVVLGWLRLTAARTWSPRAWALLGLAGGLMMAVRWQNAIVLLLPAATMARALVRSMAIGTAPAMRRSPPGAETARPDSPPAPRQVVVAAALFGVAALAGFLPQLLAWHAIYGQWVARSPIAPAMFWAHPQIADLLWSSRSGLFATSPALCLGAIGLVLLWRRDRRLSAAGLVVFALMAWTNGAVEDWWGGAGYGGRRFDSLIPFFTVGLAACLAWLAAAVRRRPAATAVVLMGLLVVWNVSLMAVARGGRVYRIGQPVSFGDLAAGQAREIHDAVGHPPSWPANLAWALRNGIGPGRYDVLAPRRFLGDPARQYGRVDVGTDDEVFLGDGWHQPERAGDGTTFRWARAEAGVLIPLDHAADLALQIRLVPFTYDAAPPQTLVVRVGDTALPPVVLVGDWQVIELPAPARLWRAGVNVLTLDFSRETRPADVGASDGRPLAAAVDYVRVQVTGR